MADNLECEICGGTDFYKESGYFFCNECQTQSQQIKEHVFQHEVQNLNAKVKKKFKKRGPDKTENTITSWECYNIVICSLTQQLIDLGADKKLKPIVKCLWMRYLEKLEVVNLKYNTQPKLPLINNIRDAKVLYGVVKKRKGKRKRTTSDESSVSQNTTILNRERGKKKRILAQVEYAQIAKKSAQGDTSLNNETLTSLKSGSEKSSMAKTPIIFNRYSVNELRRQMSRRHYLKHKFDKERTLKCHRLVLRECSADYGNGVKFISPNKLYCILYLGLLINNDKIQLGDLLRFIREGHLSFNNYSQLLGEDYADKFLNISNNSKNQLFSNKGFRRTAAMLAKFLNVVHYIAVIDLTSLCQRFCKEMNLPGEVFSAVENLISKTNPRLRFTKRNQFIPNYEGRAVSMILFTLKLLFGLDGVTEFEFSKYAQSVNLLKVTKQKMFDIVKWIKHIGYRDLLIHEYHFPSAHYKNSDEVNTDLYVQYLKFKNTQVEENVKITKEMQDYKELLVKMCELQNSENMYTEFPPSLTPFVQYSKILLNKLNSDQATVLSENFEGDSLDFLLRPNKYLQLVGENVEVKHGGANDKWIMEDVKTPFKNSPNYKLTPVEIIEQGSEQNISEVLSKLQKPPYTQHDRVCMQAKYQECRQHLFRENEIYVKRVSQKVEDFGKLKGLKRYNNHFNPYERYWLYLQMNMDLINKNKCEECFDKFTDTFKLIFKECARTIEQRYSELLQEFQYSELFLTYATMYKGKGSGKPDSRKLLKPTFIHYVKHAEVLW